MSNRRFAAVLSVLAFVPFGTCIVFGQQTGDPVLTVSHESLQWTEAAGAAAYQVVRGDLVALRQSGGDFRSSMRACLVEATSRTEMSYQEVPGPGEAFWFFVRALSDTESAASASCGSGPIGTPDREIGLARFNGGVETRRTLVGGGESSSNPTFKAAVSTSSASYTTGQTVDITWTVTNITSVPVTVSFPDTCQAYFMVQDALGSVVYDDRPHAVCDFVLTDITWQPGQSVVFRFSWPQTSNAGLQVPAGASYRIRGYAEYYEPVPNAVTQISIQEIPPP